MFTRRYPEESGEYLLLEIRLLTNRIFHSAGTGIREIPDHATFRETVQTLTWLDKLRGFLSLALCN